MASVTACPPGRDGRSSRRVGSRAAVACRPDLADQGPSDLRRLADRPPLPIGPADRVVGLRRVRPAPRGLRRCPPRRPGCPTQPGQAPAASRRRPGQRRAGSGRVPGRCQLGPPAAQARPGTPPAPGAGGAHRSWRRPPFLGLPSSEGALLVLTAAATRAASVTSAAPAGGPSAAPLGRPSAIHATSDRLSVGTRGLIVLIRLYQVARAGRVSPCRFTPTCSQYAVEALAAHGVRRGLRLSLGRLARCRPGGPFGADPVPD